MKVKKNPEKKVKRNSKLKRKIYSQDDVYKALKSMEDGMSSRNAATLYNIPRSTLYAKYKFIIPVEATRGPRTYLSSDEENEIVQWILHCSERGFPITKSVLLKCVQKLVTKLKRVTPFKDNKPGRHWYKSFLKRHDNIKSRVAQNLTAGRVSATEEVIRKWFGQVEDYFKKFNLIGIDRSRIFNLDESAFHLTPKGDRVLAQRGSKTVYKIVNGDKESVTVLFNVSGAGVMLPPMLLFWYERIPAYIGRSLPPSWIIGNTERGWMTSESFYCYIANHFYHWLLVHKIEFPVVLFVDGHSSHLSLPLSKFCREKKIILIALYPNATHILQPLDVAVFKPLKEEWKKTIDNYRLEFQTTGIKKDMFAPLLKQTIDNMVNLPTIIKNGFQTCGLNPLNANAIDYKLIKNPKKKNISTSPQEKASSTVQTQQFEEECHQALTQLQYLEKSISKNTLEEFNFAFIENDSTKISTSNESLYDYWMKLKHLSGINVEKQVEINSNEVAETEPDEAKEVTIELNGEEFYILPDSEVIIEELSCDQSTLSSTIIPNIEGERLEQVTEENLLSNDELDAQYEPMDLSVITNYKTNIVPPKMCLEDEMNNNVIIKPSIVPSESALKDVENNNVSNVETSMAPAKNVFKDITNTVKYSKENIQSTKVVDFKGVMKETFYYPPDVTKPQKKGKPKISPVITSEEYFEQQQKLLQEKEKAKLEVEERKRAKEEQKHKRTEIELEIKRLQLLKKELTAKKMKKEEIKATPKSA